MADLLVTVQYRFLFLPTSIEYTKASKGSRGFPGPTTSIAVAERVLMIFYTQKSLKYKANITYQSSSKNHQLGKKRKEVVIFCVR
jgi:hypothetical protein